MSNISCDYGWYLNFDSDKKTRYSRVKQPLYNYNNSSADICKFGCFIQPECLKKSSGDVCKSTYNRNGDCYCFINSDKKRDTLFGTFNNYYSYPEYKEKEAHIVEKLFKNICLKSTAGAECSA